MDLALPRLALSSSASLVEPLKERGLEPVFAGDDLDGIAKGTAVGEAAQQAVPRVDEEGTVAVAGVVSAPAPPRPR